MELFKNFLLSYPCLIMANSIVTFAESPALSLVVGLALCITALAMFIGTFFRPLSLKTFFEKILAKEHLDFLESMFGQLLLISAFGLGVEQILFAL